MLSKFGIGSKSKVDQTSSSNVGGAGPFGTKGAGDKGETASRKRKVSVMDLAGDLLGGKFGRRGDSPAGGDGDGESEMEEQGDEEMEEGRGRVGPDGKKLSDKAFEKQMKEKAEKYVEESRYDDDNCVGSESETSPPPMC